MFTVKISIATLEEILSDFKKSGGDSVKFTVYDSTDEIPDSITLDCLKNSVEIPTVDGGSFFPLDTI